MVLTCLPGVVKFNHFFFCQSWAKPCAWVMIMVRVVTISRATMMAVVAMVPGDRFDIILLWSRAELRGGEGLSSGCTAR